MANGAGITKLSYRLLSIIIIYFITVFPYNKLDYMTNNLAINVSDINNKL